MVLYSILSPIRGWITVPCGTSVEHLPRLLGTPLVSSCFLYATSIIHLHFYVLQTPSLDPRPHGLMLPMKTRMRNASVFPPKFMGKISWQKSSQTPRRRIQGLQPFTGGRGPELSSKWLVLIPSHPMSPLRIKQKHLSPVISSHPLEPLSSDSYLIS